MLLYLFKFFTLQMDQFTTFLALAVKADILFVTVLTDIFKTRW